MMDFNEYQNAAARTFPNGNANINHAVFGLASEAGEVAGIFQKTYQGHKLDISHVEKELGDCLWMLAEACTALGTSLEYVAWLNIEKLKKRYPNGFESEKSINRESGDI